MNDTVIKVDGVSKKYCRSIKHTMFYGASDLTRSFLGFNQQTERLRDGEFWAVDWVSFELKKGETLGIIGPNGSGKSTMLKLLNGIFMPDKGKIEINGRVGALIEVGAGFHPMLTGRENIYVNGAILGMSKKEIDKKFDEIVDFADIGDFIDSPVKHYSSGMHVRLGFAIAVYCEPDILLVDEVLAVGDLDFQSKCLKKISEMRKREVTTIFVSHRMPAISSYCQKALYVNKGKEKYQGDVADAIDLYKRDMAYKGELGESQFVPGDVRGSGAIRINKIQFLDENGNKVAEINTGSTLTLRIHYKTENFTGKVELDICIMDERGNVFFRETNVTNKKQLIVNKKAGYFDIIFKNMCANNQKLLFHITLWRDQRTELFDWKRDMPLYVAGNPLSHGTVLLNVDWVVN